MDITGTRGDIVTITGSNLYNTPESAIYFNAINDSGRVRPILGSFSGNSLFKFEVPSSLPKNNTIYYYNTADSGLLDNVNFVFIGEPSIKTITPSTGFWRDTIILSGENFVRVKSIFIGGTEVKEYSVSNENLLSFVIPDESKSNKISLTATGGSTISSGDYPILTVKKPSLNILKISPISGKYGDTILISGTSLDNVSQVTFSGIENNLTVMDFTTVNTTGVYVKIPTGSITNKKVSVQYAQDLTTGGFFNPLIAETAYSSQDLIILNEYINNISPQDGLYGDIITISGNGFNHASFFFEGFNTGDRNYISPISTNIINNNKAELIVPKNIVKGAIYVSGISLTHSLSSFTPLPSIVGFENQNLQIGTLFSLSGINIAESFPALFVSGFSTEANHIIANRNTENIPIQIVRGQDPNKQQKYFGDIGFDFSELLASYPQSLTTGNMKMTGIINSNYFGLGKAFLVSKNEISSIDSPVSHLHYISLLDDFNLAFPFGKERLDEVSRQVEISGKRPFVRALNLERTGPTGTLFITGNYFFGITGIRFTDGYFDSQIPIAEINPYPSDLKIETTRTGLELNSYEKSHTITVDIEKFNYLGKSGSFLLGIPYYTWA